VSESRKKYGQRGKESQNDSTPPTEEEKKMGGRRKIGKETARPSSAQNLPGAQEGSPEEFKTVGK